MAARGAAGLARWGRAAGLRARRALLRAGLGACAALLLLWAAIFLYGSFYYCYVPAAAFVRPVHLRFRTDCDPPGPELCSFPTANVSLLGDNREQVLRGGQRYRLLLELTVPESRHNRGLGMFLVTARTYGPGGRTLRHSARPAMLHYRSGLLRGLEVLALAGLFLGGFLEQAQTLQLELFDGYREDPYVPTVGAELQLHSRRLQLYGARLHVHAHFTGLRYLLFHFPLAAALLGVAGNWTLLTLLLLAGYLQWGRGQRRPLPRPAPPAPPSCGAPPPPGEGEEEEAPQASSNEPELELLGPAEPHGDPPTAPNDPPEEEEEETEEGEGQEGVATPLPPPAPTLRLRPVCSSS